MINDYLRLSLFGKVVGLDMFVEDSSEFIKDTEINYQYVKYNPRKPIERYGLSITSLDGGLSGRPDLDSLLEYNKENNTSYTEGDFRVPTPIYYDDRLKNVIKPFEGLLTRTHILKLNPGGFFPAHRDSYYDLKYFRIIVPLSNVNPPLVYFILDDIVINSNMEEGRAYFVDTVKAHTIFNCSFDPSYWLVLNVDCVKEAVDIVVKNLRET